MTQNVRYKAKCSIYTSLKNRKSEKMIPQAKITLNDTFLSCLDIKFIPELTFNIGIWNPNQP